MRRGLASAFAPGSRQLGRRSTLPRMWVRSIWRPAPRRSRRRGRARVLRTTSSFPTNRLGQLLICGVAGRSAPDLGFMVGERW